MIKFHWSMSCVPKQILTKYFMLIEWNYKHHWNWNYHLHLVYIQTWMRSVQFVIMVAFGVNKEHIWRSRKSIVYNALQINVYSDCKSLTKETKVMILHSNHSIEKNIVFWIDWFYFQICLEIDSFNLQIHITHWAAAG